MSRDEDGGGRKEGLNKSDGRWGSREGGRGGKRGREDEGGRGGRGGGGKGGVGGCKHAAPDVFVFRTIGFPLQS